MSNPVRPTFISRVLSHPTARLFCALSVNYLIQRLSFSLFDSILFRHTHQNSSNHSPIFSLSFQDLPIFSLNFQSWSFKFWSCSQPFILVTFDPHSFPLNCLVLLICLWFFFNLCYALLIFPLKFQSWSLKFWSCLQILDFGNIVSTFCVDLSCLTNLFMIL